MIKALSLSNPYSYSITSDGSAYEFTTDNGVVYHFYFSPANQHLDESYPFYNDILEFSFEPVGNKFNGNDSRVKDTIIAVLAKVLSNPQIFILYMCDGVDQQQYARERLFRSWMYNYLNQGYGSIDFALEESNAVGSIIFLESNPNKDLIFEFMNSKLEEYRGCK